MKVPNILGIDQIEQSNTLAYLRRKKKVMPSLLAVCNVRRQPVKTFVKPLAGGGAGGLDKPMTLSNRVQTKLVCDFCGGHCIWKVLFVGKNEEHRITKLIFVEHAVKFIPCF